MLNACGAQTYIHNIATSVYQNVHLFSYIATYLPKHIIRDSRFKNDGKIGIIGLESTGNLKFTILYPMGVRSGCRQN